MALKGGAIDAPAVGVIGSTSFLEGLSVFFLTVALITVPWMLFIKPVLIDKHNQA